MRWKKKNNKQLPVGLLLVVFSFTASGPATPRDSVAPGIDPPAREVLRGVRINGVATGATEHILRLNTGRLAALSEAFQRWRIRLPPVEPILHGGRKYFPLDAATNLSYQIDKSTRELLLDGPPYVFLPTTSGGTPEPLVQPAPSGPISDDQPAASTAGAQESLGSQPANSPAPSKAPPECGAELLLTVLINGVIFPICEHLVHLTNGRLAALPQAFQHWRIRLPTAAPIRYEGEDYFPLDAVKGLSYHINEAIQELVIEAPPNIFLPTRVSEQPGSLSHMPAPSPGGFFNYDLSSLSSPGATSNSGLLELGAFNRHGVGTGTFLWQDTGDNKGVTRLDTTWTRDEPDNMFRLRLGDTISRSGAWGRSIRFGGIQWGTSFATQPGFVPFPLPGTRGEAALPSTVDVYVNNTLRLHRDVPSGPFEIFNVPVITGQGDVRLVVTDLLGRQQVITQPYYASPTLLRKDLTDYSYEAGFVRNKYGVNSDDYGRFLGAATYRLGVTNHFTRELRAEVLRDQQTAGVSGVYLWPTFGTGNASVALSHSPAGNGGLLSMGVQRLAQQMSFTLQGQFNSRQFAQVGLLPGATSPRQTLTATVGFSLPGKESVSLSYLRQSYWSQADNRLVSASYSVSLGRDYFLSIFALESRNSSTNRSIGVTITRPLGPHTSASANFTHQTGGDSTMAQVQRNLPEGPGFGYRLLTENGPNERTEAGGFMQTNVGTYSAEASQLLGTTRYRLGASGGVAFLGGVFPSRRIDNSFAVVKAGEYPGVQIYRDNQPARRTDSQGLAMIPNLRAYEQNLVSIEPADLPLDAQIDKLRLLLTPYLRSGVMAEFPVRPSKGGVITLVLEDGSYLPAGAVVRIVAKPDEFPVAYRGEAYLTGLAEVNELQVTWKDQECHIRMEAPPEAGPLPNLGTFVCKGVKP